MTDTLENRYYRFLGEQRYNDPAFLRRVLSVYLPYFADRHRVLDIGCGRGEFLEMLTVAGHEAVGVDVDPAMVETCVDQGLTAFQADVLEWLPAQGQAFDGIFSSNVIEHLAVPQVLALFSAAFRALKPDGILLVAVPNPESLVVQLHEFWRDATHVRLYSRHLLEFLFHDSGFQRISSGENEQARWEGAAGTHEGHAATEPSASSPAQLPFPAPDFAVGHVPPLPRPMRRIGMMEAYWEALRRELELLGEAITKTAHWVEAADRRLGVVEAPYAASREVFVVGYKPSQPEPAP